MPTLEPIEYRCCLLDRYGHVVWRFKLLVVNDDEAIAASRTLFRQHSASVSGFELWQERRYVYCANGAAVVENWAHHAHRRGLPRQFHTALSRLLMRRSRYV